ncbi:MAG: DUF3793 family protein [Oscillospiraceae bacterium]|nr:DUF3793 family protein [Oscillospiraceae bacterium]
MSEHMLIDHCSPTLAGVKTGSLFTCDYKSKNKVYLEIRRINRILVPKGLRLLPLRFHKGKVLIYLYRPDQLENDLTDHTASRLLRQCGYSLKNGNYCIVELIGKLNSAESFPHEIGLFLGYPPEDVDGFMNGSPADFKYSGLWKVYGDVDKAKKTFARYRKCSEHYKGRWQKGTSLEQLAVCC